MKDNQIKEICVQYGSPLYVYDGDKIKEKYNTLQSSLPGNFEIFFSMKANPLLGICQLFNKLGSGIEVASSGELYTALAAGFVPQNIIFTSPGKTPEELEYAISEGIYSINVESLEEVGLIDRIAQAHSKRVNISVRINPDFDISGAGIKMTGVATQFGVDQKQTEYLLNRIRNFQNVNLVGIHIYTGTQMLNVNNIAANMEEIIKLALDIKNTGGVNLQFLDLGGGFGIPYFNNETDLDMETLQEKLNSVWDKYGDKLSGTRIAVESGRYLLAESGAYVTRVLYCKENKGKRYAICDGGSSQHANSAFLGRFVRNNFPMHLIKENTGVMEVDMVGPLCTPTDVIGQKVTLPEVFPGDILVIEKSGAYGLTDSPVLFLSHPLPAEVIYYEGRVHVLRERGRKEDFLTGQNRLFE
ncbi:MAG: diaminopimelate decarboxylase [Bacillota bacterium]|nr:diaminopimelate decarboxylase [Bacillota bacterium]